MAEVEEEEGVMGDVLKKEGGRKKKERGNVERRREREKEGELDEGDGETG